MILYPEGFSHIMCSEIHLQMLKKSAMLLEFWYSISSTLLYINHRILICDVVAMIPQLPNVEVCVLEQCPSWEARKIMQNEIMSLEYLWDCKLTQKCRLPLLQNNIIQLENLTQANSKVGVVVIEVDGGSSSKFFIYLNATLKLNSPWYWCIPGQLIGP